MIKLKFEKGLYSFYKLKMKTFEKKMLAHKIEVYIVAYKIKSATCKMSEIIYTLIYGLIVFKF